MHEERRRSPARAHPRARPRGCSPKSQTEEGEDKALTPRPCYEADAGLTAVRKKRVVWFIALKGELARTQPSCDDESGTSGDERSHTGKGANTDFH